MQYYNEDKKLFWVPFSLYIIVITMCFCIIQTVQINLNTMWCEQDGVCNAMNTRRLHHKVKKIDRFQDDNILSVGLIPTSDP